MRALLTLALLSLASPVLAQPHPCDAPAPTTQRISAATPTVVQVCALPAEQVEVATVYINGVKGPQKPLTQVQGPNAQGLALYETAKDQVFARGTFTVQVSTWNRPFAGAALVEGPKSSPLDLTAVDDLPPPTAPKFLGVRR